MVIDPDYLALLRANAEEVRADLEERELRMLEDDPQAAHDAVMEATRPNVCPWATYARGYLQDP